MTGTDTKDDASQFSCPYSAGAELDQVLKKAEALLQSADVEEALELLMVVEKRYVRAAKLFDLLGDALLRCGNIEEGVRYKTLHEILRGTFKIATDEAACSSGRSPRMADSDYAAVLNARPTGQDVCSPVDAEPLAPCEIPRKRGKTEDFIPVTEAMGHELMRQGHFDRASEIFALLAARHPEDQSLQQAQEQARRRGRQTLVLDILQRWLGNIERMKSSHPSEA
jgi:tetratricopeptide (TPR) repeat protein